MSNSIAETNSSFDEDRNKGLYKKFFVERRFDPMRKHLHCDFFVLDLNHDEFATKALLAYAEACKDKYPILSKELIEKLILLNGTQE